jgi:hypothetical protein
MSDSINPFRESPLIANTLGVGSASLRINIFSLTQIVAGAGLAPTIPRHRLLDLGNSPLTYITV